MEEDPLGKQLPFGENEYENSMEIRVPMYAPKVSGMKTYSSSPDQPLLGVPIREGTLWHLSAQDRFESVNFSLYVNGFAFSTSDGLEASVSLSPFSLVRNCRFQSGECSKLKSFKVSLLEPDPCCYFAVRSIDDREAEEERSDWVLSLSHTILLITDSLLPPNSITCNPLRGVPRTNRRLMAGYLIHRDDAETVMVVYCELQAPSSDVAALVVYENELCQRVVMEICICETSVCQDVVGINCSCFMVDSHQFASQSPSERKLWLRALSNMKVKLQNKAPVPSGEELWHYRAAIREHIAALEATQEARIVKDALLREVRKKDEASVASGPKHPYKPQAQLGGDTDVPEVTKEPNLKHESGTTETTATDTADQEKTGENTSPEGQGNQVSL
eukprot:TRINITY_DN24558_c0_g1_i2.p1 TRINITY_DN24558_c0_g1~~TRINITY_DN24558_c0_g1_i2.p1  ORF type:complete len:419 (-),score=73.15 TRINITY_DN24558_c0_g1_i2:30-1196(-)